MSEQKQEHPSTYFVQDRSSVDEMTRLHIQGQMLTTSMGGVLPEQADSTSFHRVLDVACGTGGWLIELAKTYPSMSQLIGVDVSNKMLEYATARAKEEQVSERVQFRSMDALRMLEFPSDHFDLVNMRSGTGFLRTWDWPKLLSEFKRVSKADGVIRVTEVDFIVESSSPALNHLNRLIVDAFSQAGHLFTPGKRGVIGQLAHLFTGQGFHNVQTRPLLLEYRMGTEQGDHFSEDMKMGYRAGLPFIRKWTRVPDDYEEIYQQAVMDMQQPDFVATWELVTVWGQVAFPIQ